jgi:dipeptidyl aminopeptidase/acylaminoacyl peptidase
VDFDGENFVVLTSGNGTNEVEFSPDRSFFIDTYSRVDMAPVVELRRGDDGKLIRVLQSASLESLVATGWQTPERFSAKGRDGVTDIYGVIYRPSNFDASKSYPILESIYAGPHGSHVPKKFSVFRREQEMAELGFVVVQIDGMGTSNRSKAFHDVCWKNLGDSGFPDRMLWIKAVANKYPYMDLNRIGLYGGSAGGQSALRGLLVHGDFYKVAVADCGCHDNRMDKVWWNELWMGYPIDDHYSEQSNVTLAHQLSGKLMLVVGELDENVDPASTMQVVNALVKADKDFDLLILPGVGHGAAETPYGHRRRKDFLVRHLLGVEPRHP